MTCRLSAVLAGVLLLAAVPAAHASNPAACTPATPSSTCYSGSTIDGGVWSADVPSPWNGTLLLYSHGFGPIPTTAPDAPDSTTKQALLNMGYALAGSSYDPHGSWWALGSALKDQFETLTDVQPPGVLPATPQHVYAFGTSMGGLISALEDEHSNGRIDGALTTCGIVAGAIQLNNYQLDGEYAMSQLLGYLLQGQTIKLVRFDNPGDGLATGYQLDQIAQLAQPTPQGQARLSLAMAFMNVSTWDTQHAAPPAPNDYTTQEQEQYNIEFAPSGPPPIQTTMDFVEFGRPWIELAAGGNGAWTAGVDFERLFERSSYAPEVRYLYRQAHLSLDRDLDTLTRSADITADPNAIQWLEQTSVPTGRLQVPELDLHTISDQLVPVQQENYYGHTVRRADREELLRQAFVERQLHCKFNPSELVAGVLAVQHRVTTGRWDDVAEPESLNAMATSLNLGPSAFIPYYPPPLSGDNGPFSPYLDRTWWW